MRGKGTTFGELLIVLFIISTALVIFLKISTDYIRTLVLAKEMFILNSVLQERYQFLIAYRNKHLEKDFGSETIEQRQMPNLNFNCIYFNNGNFGAFRLPDSSISSCQVNFLGSTPLSIKYIIKPTSTINGIYKFKIEGKIEKWKDLSLSLEGFLTPWHPSFMVEN